MRKIFYLLAAGFLGIISQACVSTISLKAVPLPDQTIETQLTTKIIKSHKTNSVFVRILTEEFDYGQKPAIYVVVGNFSNEPFEFSTKDIRINSNDTPLKVYGLKEYRRLLRREAVAMAMAVGLSAAGASMAAAAPSQTYYRGSFAGQNFSGYAQTYNPAAAAQAQAVINANMLNQMMAINATQQINLMALESMLKNALIKPGEIYGGVIRFDIPAFAMGETKEISLKIRTPHDAHNFSFLVKVERENDD